MNDPVNDKSQGNQTQNNRVDPFAPKQTAIEQIINDQKWYRAKHAVHTKCSPKIQPQNTQPGPGHTAAGAGEVEEFLNRAGNTKQQVDTQ